MQSRMDRYKTSEKKKYERSLKNTKLYEEVYDDMYRDTTYKNMQIIDTAKEININKLKNMLDDKYDTRQYRTFKNYDIEDINIDKKPTFKEERPKTYDINQILDDAKSKRAFIEEAKEKQKFMDFTERRGIRHNNKYDEMEKDEEELVDLINTMTIPKQSDDTNDALDMFEDLKGNENTIVTTPIDASFEVDKETLEKTKTEDIKNNLEKTLVKADRTFYTDSNMFTKNDFEDFSTLTRDLKRSKKSKVVIFVILLLVIIAAVGYFVATKYVLK